MQRAPAETFDLVFLDPPFDAYAVDAALAAASRLVRPEGFVYLEARSALPEAPAGWAVHRRARAGAVHFHLLRRDGPVYTVQPDPETRTAP
jgi:16S rRNA G966 N2-methylase RsmD